jgi:DNA-directed RNA polymerase subunit alpha
MSEGLDTVVGGGAVDEGRAKASFELGQEQEREGNRIGAIDHYREAVTHGRNSEHMHRLAFLLDLVGEEEESIAIYEEICQDGRPPLGSLINLAIAYEDRGDLAKAEYALKQVIESDPNNPRARLFMADVQASRGMFYDDEADRMSHRHNALLDTPVTDFELSVRARNCLKKMQIRTLGDLLRVTEVELNSYKNVGDTTINEIKNMLTAKGLRLGQGQEVGQVSRVRKEIMDQLKDQAPESVLQKPISVLDLSVRARKALQLLGVQSLGEIAARTEAELLGVKNFGQTSLDEINEKLQEHGLGLRKLD